MPELLSERSGGAAGRRCRDLVLAMIVDRIIVPALKLATVRALDPDPAASRLGEGTLVLYDVSSSYLEGRKCELARFGHSRDHRKDKPQFGRDGRNVLH